MLKNEPSVAIIIVNWNGKHLLDELFSSLQSVNYLNFFTILVDNASKDNSASYVKKQYPQIHVIQNKDNLGFSEASNIGAHYAIKQKAEYLLFLNNDIIVHADFLVELVQVAESSKQIGIVGGKIYYYDEPQKIWFAGGGTNKTGKWFHYEFNFEENDELKSNKKEKDVDWITGCMLLVRSEIFHQISGFDHRFFMYVEDIDINYRIKKAGFQIKYSPKALAWHKVAASFSEKVRTPVRFYYRTRNMLLFFHKNKPLEIWKVSWFIVDLTIKFFMYLFIDRRISIAFALAIRDFFIQKFGRIDPDSTKTIR